MTELMNILKLNKLKISYKEDAMSTILEIKSQNTSLSVIHVEETRFRETNDMMK
jgi:hypothetical protein